MRLKDFSILNPRYNGVSFTSDVSFVPMESLRNGHIDLQEISFLEGKAKYTFFANGDLLIAKVTPCFENGNIAIADGLKNDIGFGSSEIFVLRMNKNVLNKYMFYFVQTIHFQDAACATMCGVGGLKRISPLMMRTYELNIPLLPKQRQIVDYLDEKTAEIDNQISLLSKKQDAYLRLKKSTIHQAVTQGLNPNVEMKHSGEEWIGYIPSHWNKYRLKDLSYMYSGLTGKSGEDFRCDDLSKTKPYIPFTNVLNNFAIDFSKYNYVVMDDKDIQNIVHENDLIFLMSSEDYESIAKSAVVVGDPGEVYLNSFCRGLHFTKKINSEFINYQLNSPKYRDALRFEARGFTRINIKIEKISSMFVCLPPLDEQNTIVEYLNQKNARIDSIINNIETQIEKYKLLKRALINEVVTGQRAI